MFDLNILKNNRLNALKEREESEFYHFICEDIIDRIKSLNVDFRKILILYTPIKQKILNALQEIYSNAEIEERDDDNIKNEKYDLIICPFYLHWIVDVPNFLHKIKAALKDSGVFMGNFAGEGSLQNVRKKMIEVESQCNSPHSPHIIAFIRLDHTTMLLQQAGYAENIVDMSSLEIESDSLLDFMRNLKKYGESNVLISRENYSINKEMYVALSQFKEKFIDHVNLISFISSPQKGVVKIGNF